MKSAQLIKLLQEECNKKEEIKPNYVDNLTNSDMNTSEIISNEWCSGSSKSYNKTKKSTGCLNKPIMKTSNKFAVLSEVQTQATVQRPQPSNSAPSKQIKKSHTKTHKIYLIDDSHIIDCPGVLAIVLVAHMVFLESQNPMLSQMQSLLQ